MHKRIIPFIIAATSAIAGTIAITGTTETAIAQPMPKLYSTCPSVGWALFIPGDHDNSELGRAVPSNRGINACTHEFNNPFLQGRVSGSLVAIPVSSYADAKELAIAASRSLKTDNIFVIYMSDQPAG